MNPFNLNGVQIWVINIRGNKDGEKSFLKSSEEQQDQVDSGEHGGP